LSLAPRDERAGWGNGEHGVGKLDRLVADGILVLRLPDAEIEMRKAASHEVFEQGGEENFAGRKSRGCAVAVEGIGQDGKAAAMGEADIGRDDLAVENHRMCFEQFLLGESGQKKSHRLDRKGV